MNGSKRPIIACDAECAYFNDCRVGGIECERCGEFFCSSEIGEDGLCDECRRERDEEEEQEDEL